MLLLLWWFHKEDFKHPCCGLIWSDALGIPRKNKNKNKKDTQQQQKQECFLVRRKHGVCNRHLYLSLG